MSFAKPFVAPLLSPWPHSQRVNQALFQQAVLLYESPSPDDNRKNYTCNRRQNVLRFSLECAQI